MDQSRFKIVFEKLAEAQSQGGADQVVVVSEAVREEIDAIAELRRLVLETTESDQKSYTTT